MYTEHQVLDTVLPGISCDDFLQLKLYLSARIHDILIVSNVAKAVLSDNK
jgi:hypothetical protein